MRIYFDHNLPYKLSKALNELSNSNFTVKHFRDVFNPNTSDIDWIQHLNNSNNIVVTNDRKILRNPHERKAWDESNLKMIFLHKSWSSLTFWNISWRFVKYWQNIEDIATRLSSGSGCILFIGGKIDRI